MGSQDAEFQRGLEAALKLLKSKFPELLEEIPILVEDEPTRDQLAEVGIFEVPAEGSDLCGLFFGPTRAELDSTTPNPESPGIYLFRGPLERLAGADIEILAEEIEITLLHEMGHYLGLEEEDLERLGYD